MGKNGVDFNAILEELSRADLEPKALLKPRENIMFDGVVADSRRVSKATVFCAIRGSTFDGHDFVLQTKAPLPLVIIEQADLPVEKICASSIIHVRSTRAAWAQLESFFLDHPGKHLKLIGITGTNGKTSTVWMVGEIMRALSERCATIGTLGINYGGHREDTLHTTPDPDVLYPTLHKLVSKGVKYVAMETSSHALDQGKLWPLRFRAAGFCSFSQDHLDYHKDMDSYLNAKLLLFGRLLDRQHHCMIHNSLLQYEKIRTLCDSSENFRTYGQSSGSNYRVRASSNRLLGMTTVTIESPALNAGRDHAQMDIPMIGDVFAENFALAAILTSQCLNVPLQVLANHCLNSKISAVPGRLQLVKNLKLPWRPLVYIDYAHTPDALEKSLCNLSDKKTTLSVLFGCGGDRDKLKRPQMGAVAARHALKTYITTDNPRTEDPQSILDAILVGYMNSTPESELAAPRVRVIPDRRDAIFQAISHSYGRDCLLIAGKGHESYQIIGQQKLPFSDHDVATEALALPRTWLVVGAGLSGFAAADHLYRCGDKVFIYDDRPIELPPQLIGHIIPCSLSEIPWAEISTIVTSPGIPPDHALLKRSHDLNLPVISEVDLGLHGYPGRTLAVTGTNGKSTTVAMTEFLGKHFGLDLTACGNIGRPPSTLNLRQTTSDTSIVIELSSYQLDGSYCWPSVAAAITSFSSDHLARHKTLENYFKAKWSISNWLEPGALFLVSSQVANIAKSYNMVWPNARVVVIGPDASKLELPIKFEPVDIRAGQFTLRGQKYNFEDYGIEGQHNQANALFASLMLSEIYGKPTHQCLEGLAKFNGLPFRCQVVFKGAGFRVINDSKSTNLESTLAALTMTPKPAILLMGGQGKGEPYNMLADAKHKIKKLVVFGASRAEIARDASTFINGEQHESMQSAVLSAMKLAMNDKVDVLFSPGCASFDEFKNFEHRGEIFNQIVAHFFRDNSSR